MYFYLTGALKRKVIRELKMCFRHMFPAHKDILEYINHKYAFRNRPQKGIVVTNASANPRRLSSDNFVGTIMSHVMLSQVDHHPGLSLEWVKEDLRRIDHNDGMFPSLPGIYYIEVLSDETIQEQMSDAEYQDLLDAEGEHGYYFYVDPLLKSSREALLEITTGNETSAVVMNAPVLPNTIRVFANREELISGRHLKLTATQSLHIDPVLPKKMSLGLPTGQIPAIAKGTVTEPFDIIPNSNDLLDFEINGTSVSIPLQSGLRTASEIAGDIRNALYTVVPPEDFEIRTSEGSVVIEARESLNFSSDTLSTANSTLGFTEGFVPVVAEGKIFHHYFEQQGSLTMTVDGVEQTIPLFSGNHDPDELATFIENEMSGITAESVESGDYVFDPDTGEITFERSFEVGTKITASYKYPIDSKGPFGIKKDHSNNHAIPGVVLAFGRRLSDGDKMAVVVNENRVATAAEYGGRWEVSVDLDIITRDPMVREELSDMVLMYFFAVRKEYLTEEGLELTDISFGGESEEIYDDTANDFYFNSSVSLTFQTDWSIHVPKPLIIERLTPTSFGEEARVAGTNELPDSDLYGPAEMDTLNLKRIGSMYLKGKTRDFERIK